MKLLPVCVKLITGEELFSQIVEIETPSEIVMLKQPFITMMLNTNHGPQLGLRPWSVFTDDEFYSIMQNHIISISSLDSMHLKMYGSILLSQEVSKIQDEVRERITKENDVGRVIEEGFMLISAAVMHNVTNYLGKPPSLVVLKDQYAKFVFSLYEPPAHIAKQKEEPILKN